jgi:hypothetical protein
MTADEFEHQYAERSGTTVERLRELGRIVAPCDCGWDICEGWQSTTLERLLDARCCVFCGVPLFGGATAHKPDCEIQKLIAEHFPSRERGA